MDGRSNADATGDANEEPPASDDARSIRPVTNAMRASGEITPVLRVAAEQALTRRTRKRKRRQEMATDLVIVSLSSSRPATDISLPARVIVPVAGRIEGGSSLWVSRSTV